MVGDRLWRQPAVRVVTQDSRAFRKRSDGSKLSPSALRFALFIPAEPQSRNYCRIAMNIARNNANEFESSRQPIAGFIKHLNDNLFEEAPTSRFPKASD